MRAVLSIVLGVIAVGVLLIAYSLLSPRAKAAVPAWNGAPMAADSRGDAYQLARPMLGHERADVGNATSPLPVWLRCELGQRAVVRSSAERKAPLSGERSAAVRVPSTRHGNGSKK
jgi:hypothetical protein